MCSEFRGVQLTISGESWAGKYIPIIAEYVVKQQQQQHQQQQQQQQHQQQQQQQHQWINLYGVAIGNGAIDPIQEASYAEYAYSHGLIPLEAKLEIDASLLTCELSIIAKYKRSSSSSKRHHHHHGDNYSGHRRQGHDDDDGSTESVRSVDSVGVGSVGVDSVGGGSVGVDGGGAPTRDDFDECDIMGRVLAAAGS